MRLKQLEMRLSGLSGFSRPDPRFEQYHTPAGLAARLLFHACMRGDITGRRVCDLGSGTGVLAIGALLLGAREAVGVELDSGALTVARENALQANTRPIFVQGDVQDPGLPGTLGTFDTVVMNPPFGAQAVHADRPFIDAALRLAGVVYGIFNAGSREFVASYIAGRGTIDEAVGGSFSMKRTFFFQRNDVQEVPVIILRILRM